MITTNMLILKNILSIVIPIIIILLIWTIFKKMKNKKVGIIAIVLVIVVAIIVTINIGQNSNNQPSITHSVSQQQTFKEEIEKEFDLAKKRCEEKLAFATIFGIEEELKNVYGINNVRTVSNGNVPEVEIKKDGMTAYVDINKNVRIK